MRTHLMTKINPLPAKSTPLLAPVSRKSFHVNINKLAITADDYYKPKPDEFPIVRQRVQSLLKMGFPLEIVQSRIRTEFLAKMSASICVTRLLAGR